MHSRPNGQILNLRKRVIPCPFVYLEISILDNFHITQNIGINYININVVIVIFKMFKVINCRVFFKNVCFFFKNMDIVMNKKTNC